MSIIGSERFHTNAPKRIAEIYPGVYVNFAAIPYAATIAGTIVSFVQMNTVIVCRGVSEKHTFVPQKHNGKFFEGAIIDAGSM